MQKVPRFIEEEVYYKDNKQLEINVIELSSTDLFKVKRVYFLSTNEFDHLSGNHAHLNQAQIFILIKGAAHLKLTDLSNKVYTFDIEQRGLYVPEAYWIELTLEPESTVLCLASENYENLNSIYNQDKFLSLPD